MRRSKTFIAISLLFSLSVKALCQEEGFEMTFTTQGLGLANFPRTFYPIITINEDKLSYTIEEGTYTLPFRQTSKDSIWQLVKDIKDTAIYRVNPCVMDGAVNQIRVRDRSFNLSYSLANTIDPVSLVIVNILNTYLPASGRIPPLPKDLLNEKECREYLKKKQSAHT
jgi:hypothetical protein